eukprot:NODE_931_length_3011_cov_0.275069.p1 type:complete len:559 gc:universal NODE_931_length_3011_cov_0.275069:566-2242(+)
METGPDEKLAQEIEEGNIEHKLILRPETERLPQLVSQLKWRLKEGNGEAFYQIGVSDDGFFVGLTENEMSLSLATLNKMAQQLDADTSVVRKVLVDNKSPTSPLAKRFLNYQNKDTKEPRFAIEVLVRQRAKLLCPEIRCLVFGDRNNGKTSLLGLLANAELDDGSGSTRLNILRHRHEVESGNTSCITQKSIGFSSTGSIIRSDIYWAEGSFEQSILETSSKVVTFIDTAGSVKYSKTVYSSFLGCPNYICVVVSASESGLTRYELELLKMAQIVNNVPTFIVVTKIDLVSQEQIQIFLEAIKQQLQIPVINCLPVIVNTEGDVLATSNKFQPGIVPIFCVSNVIGSGISLLEQFLNILPHHTSSPNHSNPLEFQIDEIFIIPNVGAVVGGLVLNGVLRVGNFYKLGPLANGKCMNVIIKTIHRQRSSVLEMSCNQAGTVCIEDPLGNVFTDSKSKDGIRLRKGMSIVQEDPTYSSMIEAVVEIITDEGIQGITANTAGRVYIGSLKQNGRIKSYELMHDKCYKVKIELQAAEWTRKGLKIIFYSPSHGLKCAGSIQ